MSNRESKEISEGQFKPSNEIKTGKILEEKKQILK